MDAYHYEYNPLVGGWNSCQKRSGRYSVFTSARGAGSYFWHPVLEDDYEPALFASEEEARAVALSLCWNGQTVSARKVRVPGERAGTP